MNQRSPRIAIVRLSALGDIVNTTIVLQLIRRHYPDAHITWVCESVFAPLLQDHPQIDRVHAVSIKALKKSKRFKDFLSIRAELKKLGPFDKIIDLQGLLKSAIVARMLGKNVHGFSKDSSREGIGAFFYATTTQIAYTENIIRRNVQLVADALDFRYTLTQIREKETTLPSYEFPYFLDPKKKNIAIVIGASWPSKQYPKESYAAVCQALGQQVQCHIVWGNEAEKKMAEWIAKKSNNATLTPQLSLSELSNLFAHCDLSIGNDTGPTHMAWAHNRPSIVLFGPTTARMMYETPINIALKSPSKVDLMHINKNDFSIHQINIHSVVNTAKKLLDTPSAR